MTRKDYQLIADSIRLSLGDQKDFNLENYQEVEDAIFHVVANLSLVLAQENALFNRGKFVTACGFPEIGEGGAR